MHFVERRGSSREVSIVHRTRVFSSSRSRKLNDGSEESEESPALMICQILLSVIRKQTRKPFNLFKQFLMFSEEDEPSIEVKNKLAGCELQIVEENIRAVCTLVRQRLLVEGFLSIKNIFLKKLRIEEAYYSEENLMVLYNSISTFQTFYMKWQGFGRLYQHFRGNRLLKLNLSKIDAISNDFTSKQLEDFHPFLITERRQVETINSYLIDRSSQDESNDQHHNRRGVRKHDEIQEHEEEASESVNYNRSQRKSRTEYDIKKTQIRDQINQKVMVTHKKEAERHQAGSTARAKEEEQGKGSRQANSQEIYLIRDYKAKGKSTQPSNFIKVPVLSENVKIVEILTARKKTRKSHYSKGEVQIQKQICQNCKFCVQMRERQEMLRMMERRAQVINVQNQAMSDTHSHNAPAYHSATAYLQSFSSNNQISNSQIAAGSHNYNQKSSHISASSHGATNNSLSHNSHILTNNIQTTNNHRADNIFNHPPHTLSSNYRLSAVQKSNVFDHSHAISTYSHVISARSHSVSSETITK